MTGLTRAQVREIDRRAVEEYGVPSIVLMENAGRGAAELQMRLNPERKPIVVMCGGGNNGGDGFVIARHLDNAGFLVGVWQPMHLSRLMAGPSMTSDAAINEVVTRRSGIHTVTGRPEALAFNGSWVVDALFGTGLAGSMRDPFPRIIEAINASGSPVLAVDIPSGLDCDTGEPLGVCVRATHTVTFVAPKVGFANPAAAQWLGTVHVAGIGAPRKLLEEFGVM